MGCQLLVVVSDLHCGSDVGLCPERVKTKAGNIVLPGDNLIQVWLGEMWNDGMRRVFDYVGKDKFALLVNGDATEGSHHRNDKDLVVADIEVHTAMAAECLKRLATHAERRFVVKGTECHTLGMEDLLAERIGAERGKALEAWHFSIKGCEIDAKHHMPVTGRKHLEASAMSISMANALSNYQRCGHSTPKVFLRGHRHVGGYFDDGAAFFGVTGAWQFLTRHGHKVVPDSIPRPSILILDWRDKKEGELPAVNQITFTPPPHEVTKA